VSVPPVQGAAAATPAAAAPSAAELARQRQIHEAAVRFEGIFMSHLVEQMMASTGAEQTSPVYAGLMSEKLGDQLAESGGIGLAAMLERQIGVVTDDGSAR
jgi:Rod binding domain-containing protein